MFVVCVCACVCARARVEKVSYVLFYTPWGSPSVFSSVEGVSRLGHVQPNDLNVCVLVCVCVCVCVRVFARVFVDVVVGVE
jgi:hypothetical protein